MRLVFRLALAIVFLAVGGMVLAAGGTAKVDSVKGRVTYRTGVKAAAHPVNKGTVLEEGGTLIVAEGAAVTVVFPDGESIEAAGPTAFRLKRISEVSRTVELLSGSINRIVAKEVTTGVHTPGDCAVVIRKSAAYVRAETTKTKVRVVFRLLEGEGAKVVDGMHIRKLGKDRPIVIERRAPAAFVEQKPARKGRLMKGRSFLLTVGTHKLILTPKGGFKVEKTVTGGVLITSIVPEGLFGEIVLDDETTFYLAPGEAIELDAMGHVIRHDGIVHVYAALDVRGIYDEAVADPSDSSFTGTKIR